MPAHAYISLASRRTATAYFPRYTPAHRVLCLVRPHGFNFMCDVGCGFPH